MSWDQIGFTEGLTRSENLPTVTPDMDPLQFEQFAPEFSASKLTGSLKSQDGKVELDLDGEKLIITDGVIERVRLGRQSDDSYGLIVKDINGNTLMQITGDINFIQSSNGRTKLDFVANKLTIKEVGGLTRVVIGEF